MLRYAALLLMLTLFAGCSGGLGQTFFVRYLPFSSTPDQQGEAALQAAVAFAKANPLMPVTIDGFNTPPGVRDFDTMAQERVRVVRARLIEGGIGRERLEVLGGGNLAYTQGQTMPTVPRDTVKIGIGL
jgi:hypothetical protein